jgi:hypothetical protein
MWQSLKNTYSASNTVNPPSSDYFTKSNRKRT